MMTVDELEVVNWLRGVPCQMRERAAVAIERAVERADRYRTLKHSCEVACLEWMRKYYALLEDGKLEL